MADDGEPVFVPAGADDIAAQFHAVVKRMSVHALTLMPDGLSEDDLDKLSVELTKGALKQ